MTANNQQVSRKRMKNLYLRLVASDERPEPREELHRKKEQDENMVRPHNMCRRVQRN